MLAFMPLESEPDITGLFPQCLAAEGFWPCRGSIRLRTIWVCRVTDPATGNCSGRYGCWNLKPECPSIIKGTGLCPGSWDRLFA